MFELFAELVVAFLGACVGVLWPAKSATWARWQKIGIILGIASFAAFGVAVGMVRFRGWLPLTWWSLGLACLLTACYMVVGNVCRAYHEDAHQ